MRILLVGFVALFALSVSVGAAQAQYYPNPVGGPYGTTGRPGGLYNNPLYGGGLFGGGLGFRPGGLGGPTISTPVVPSLVGDQSSMSTGAVADEQSDNITGHPTRFNSYGRYFFNQGGISTGSTTSSSSQGTFGNGTDPRRFSAGTAPPRGRGNTTRQ